MENLLSTGKTHYFDSATFTRYLELLEGIVLSKHLRLVLWIDSEVGL